ncbi:MAG: hypothetical protein ACOYXT_27440 [Bacteroidota bacterium]
MASTNSEIHSRTKTNPDKIAAKGKRLLLVAFFFLVVCVVLASWSKYLAWIFGGVAAYFAFLSLYNLALAKNLKRPFRYKSTHAPQSAELKAYISYHLPIVISILLGGLALALAIVFFTR